jgi:hypothetical protein
MLWGAGGGPLVGGVTYRFKIWDLVNNRAGEYQYKARILTVGTPVSASGEGGWSKPFTTPCSIQVDQFGGQAGHTTGGLSIPTPGPVPGTSSAPAMPTTSFMKFTFVNNFFLGSASLTVDVPTGVTVFPSVGVESGDGILSLDADSVQVFSGP